MHHLNRYEREIQLPGEYVSFGSLEGVEILRYKRTDGFLSGVIFRSRGKLLTARHVVDKSQLPGFISHKDPDLDISFKNDPSSKGPELGYVGKLTIENV